MVFLTLAQKINQGLGPFLLRQSINARYAVAGGRLIVDQPAVDAVCLLPLALKLVDVEVYTALRGNTSASERVGILEGYIRPALVPNERWGDVLRWQFHQRVLKWVRRQYLIAQHGPALYQLPTSIRQSSQLSRGGHRRDNNKLQGVEGGSERLSSVPTTATLTRAFGLADWTREKNTTSARAAMREIVEQKLDGELLTLRGGAICFAHVPDVDQDVSMLSLEELLEVAGGHVRYCTAFNALCEEAEIYQFWTREYIHQLAWYIHSQMVRETLLVDIGAGDGLLANLLRHAFDEIKTTTHSMGCKSPNIIQVPEILATDNGSWKIPLRAPVEVWSVEETMQRLQQQQDDNDGPTRDIIVICSWMPLHQDWTRMFRNCGLVKEYILIGECDDGQCGDLWETWGNAGFLQLEEPANSSSSSSSSNNSAETSATATEGRPVAATTAPVAPYEQDGYTRHELSELIPYQWSRFDCTRSRAGRTWSFRRSE